MMKNTICVIPARYASSRFPGKPLADICGKPMVWWVYQEAKKLTDVCGVYVATESPLLLRECQKMGLEAILTADTHASGTDRVAEVARSIKADWYLVWMGDEPLIRAKEATELLSKARTKAGYEAYMLAKTFDNPVDVVNPTTIKLALNKRQELVFMSRSCIPFPKSALHYNYYKNIGAYLMSARALEFFARTEVGDLEHIEDIELLRLLENHKKIYVSVLEDCVSMSVDTPKDLQRVVKIIESHMASDTAESKAQNNHRFLSSGGGVNRYSLKRQHLESSFSTLDSNLESKANLESSLLDSHSHGHSLDSHHRLFAQKKKGCYPLPAPLSPEKAAAFCAAKSISFGGSASLYPCLGKNAKNALLHSLNAFFLKKLALCHTRQGREAVGAIAPTYCNGAKPSAEFRENIESRVGLGSSSVYRESASPSGVPDALTPNNTLDSKKSAVCSRSGASEDSLLTSGSKFARANLHNVIRRAV